MKAIEICRFCGKNIWPWQKMVKVLTFEGYLDCPNSKGTAQGYKVDVCRHEVCTGSLDFYDGLLWKIRHPIRWFRKYIVKAALVGCLLLLVGCGDDMTHRQKYDAVLSGELYTRKREFTILSSL